MIEQYTLNGKNLNSVFGLTISDGAKTLLQFPKRKESVSTNWPEMDGIETDLADPHFEARDFRLTCTLNATSRADFKTKFYGLFAELKKQYSQTLYSYDLDLQLFLFYKDMQNLRKLTNTIQGSVVAVQFDLILGEVNPEFNIPVVHIVDEQDNFLIA
jgi:hypothetical protein